MSNDIKKFLIPKLRNISRMWPPKNQAIQAAKESVQIGFYKNGKPEYKIMFKCYICGELNDRTETQVDHVVPVVDMDGFTNWDDFITALFCDSNNLAAVCKPCHYLKSQLEVQKRKEQRKLKKKLD